MAKRKEDKLLLLASFVASLPSALFTIGILYQMNYWGYFSIAPFVLVSIPFLLFLGIFLAYIFFSELKPLKELVAIQIVTACFFCFLNPLVLIAPPPQTPSPQDMTYCAQFASYEDCVSAVPPNESGECKPMQMVKRAFEEPTIANSAEDFDHCSCVLPEQGFNWSYWSPFIFLLGLLIFPAVGIIILAIVERRIQRKQTTKPLPKQQNKGY